MTYLISTIELTESQHSFVTKCLFDNYARTGSSNQSTEYVQHLKEVHDDFIADGETPRLISFA